jgi:hypothetical protein
MRIFGRDIARDYSWKTPVLTSPWIGYGANFPTVQYFKDSAGIVHLRGCVKGGGNASMLCLLPIGYRPGMLVRSVISASNGQAAYVGFLIVDTTGNISVYFEAGTTEIAIDNVTFLAEDTTHSVPQATEFDAAQYFVEE